MESKSTADLTNDPPDYTFLPRISERKSKWILLGTIGILLAFIIVGGCLIGVYLTQKHTEAVVEMVYNGQNGKEIQQTVMYSEKNNMAAFAISTQDNNATILYDFNSALIAIRVMNTEKCYVLRMNNANSPSLKEIHKGIEYFQAENEPRDSGTFYSFKEGEKAERKTLGSIINLLCTDVPIYWGLPNNQKQNRNWSYGLGGSYNGARDWQVQGSASYQKGNFGFGGQAGYGPGGWGGSLSLSYRF